jgi:hypothetical protein
VKGILADINVIGQVTYLTQLMQAEPWAEFWQHLDLVLRGFEDVGLTATAKDMEIWQRCQDHELVLITDNRNDDTPDSLTAAIQTLGTPTSLPIFTISDLGKFGTNRDYVDRVLRTLYDYLLRIDEVRGTTSPPSVWRWGGSPSSTRRMCNRKPANRSWNWPANTTVSQKPREVESAYDYENDRSTGVPNA